jgi:hypothetical protein
MAKRLCQQLVIAFALQLPDLSETERRNARQAMEDAAAASRDPRLIDAVEQMGTALDTADEHELRRSLLGISNACSAADIEVGL